MLSPTGTRDRFSKRAALVTQKSPVPDLGDTLTFVQSLQSSLELEVILPLLLERLCLFIPGSRMSYRHESLGIELEFGGPKLKHQFYYQLKTEHQELGEIRISNSKRLNEGHLKAIEENLSHLLFPLRNAMLYQEAIRSARVDALTGVGNRFAFSRSFEREHALAMRHQNDLSLLVLDVDYFKSINDRYGHLVGDQVLREVAQAIQNAMRQTDMVFRYGGEEFTAILTKTDAEGAAVIADRVRKHVADLYIRHEGQRIAVTISIGASSSSDSVDGRAMFEQADNNLYRAKRNGRNQVCSG
ncbi:GGDEF domain-containing protein [Halioxenophilus aromaticivorans]|uniref:diguanylate cyclase n=1 Tax=Halioxenophilus aromaticivorans TaxID=1306992 RepID=A0AAV3TW91_9ALTE